MGGGSSPRWGVDMQGMQNVGCGPGPHLSDCSNLRLSRSGCVCCDDPCHGPSVEAGSGWDTQGSRTRSRVMGTPSVPSPGSYGDTLGSGTLPGPTSCRVALVRNASYTCDTVTPEEIRDQSCQGQPAGLGQVSLGPRLAFNSWSSCLHLSSARTIGLCLIRGAGDGTNGFMNARLTLY